MSQDNSFPEIDYIQQTQEANFPDDQLEFAKSPNHTSHKTIPQGQKVTKAIQKPKTQPPQIQTQTKRPVPPQFAKNKTTKKPAPQPQKPRTVQPNLNKRNKRQWKSSYQIAQINSLVPLTNSQSSTKRFKIQFCYTDSQTRKTHHASLRFGKRQARYVIDGTQSHSQALLKQAQIRKAEDPFCPNYWSLWLLNNPQCPTIQDALAYYRKKNNIY